MQVNRSSVNNNFVQCLTILCGNLFKPGSLYKQKFKKWKYNHICAFDQIDILRIKLTHIRTFVFSNQNAILRGKSKHWKYDKNCWCFLYSNQIYILKRKTKLLKYNKNLGVGVNQKWPFFEEKVKKIEIYQNFGIFYIVNIKLKTLQLRHF